MRTVDRSLGYIKYDHFLTEKWYAFGKSSAERDEFKDLNLRTDVGAGPGYQVFKSDLINLALEAGVSYINEDFDVAEDKDYAAGRGSINYDQWFFKKAFQLFHFNESFVSMDDTDDIIIRMRTGVRIPFYKGINITAQHNFNWDNQPSPGFEKTDQAFIMSLGYLYE